MIPETKAFIEEVKVLIHLREEEIHNETIVESCNRGIAIRSIELILIIEEQDKEIERLKHDVKTNYEAGLRWKNISTRYYDCLSRIECESSFTPDGVMVHELLEGIRKELKVAK